MHSFAPFSWNLAPFSNLNFFVKVANFFRYWINEYSLIQSQTLRILHFFSANFWWIFFRISRQIPENSDVCRFFNQICANKSEICRKFWIFVKKFTIIVNYSLHSLVVTCNRCKFAYLGCTRRTPRHAENSRSTPVVRAARLRRSLQSSPVDRSAFFWVHIGRLFVFPAEPWPSCRIRHSPLALQPVVVGSAVRRQMNNELKFPPNFEGLVLGCIDADFCK